MAYRVDRRLVLLGGAALALAAGLIVAAIIGRRGAGPSPASPASQGGLMVQTGRDDDIKLDPKRPLRCFVAGRLVGELPLGECARRNGVASGALDVGLDPSGALAAANDGGAVITPLPPQAGAQAPGGASPAAGVSAPGDEAGAAIPGAQARCWRYAGGEWNVLPRPMTLGACVTSLYDGVCERPGAAAYGRWDERTLRLLAGRVEISRDNRSFRTLVEQSAACAVPATDAIQPGPVQP